MALILSCLVDDAAQARTIVDRLRGEGFTSQDIAVLHPGDRLVPQAKPVEAPITPQAAVIGAGSAAVTAGAFGWLIGYGVLALPAALVGAAVGTAAGAAIGTASDEEDGQREALVRYYLPRIGGDTSGDNTRAAVLVRAQDAHGYDTVMRAFRSGRAKDIQVVGKGRMESGADPAAKN